MEGITYTPYGIAFDPDIYNFDEEGYVTIKIPGANGAEPTYKRYELPNSSLQDADEGLQNPGAVAAGSLGASNPDFGRYMQLAQQNPLAQIMGQLGQASSLGRNAMSPRTQPMYENSYINDLMRFI